MVWDPNQYLKFAQPRLRPALDLLARIDADAPARVCDLGCGAGNVTRVLAQRWPHAAFTGVDTSAEMLAVAAKTAIAATQVRWVEHDLASYSAAEPFDVIYTNAALHWLPDHAHLFPKLVAQLAPRGVLAVQMPRNFSAPSHTAIADTVRQGPWRAALEPLLAPPPVMEPVHYYALLSPLAAELELWETEYLQVLEGVDPVKEWVKGTWLTQFLARLAEPEQSAFERDYAARVKAAYPPRPDGKTLFPFRRLFIILRRK